MFSWAKVDTKITRAISVYFSYRACYAVLQRAMTLSMRLTEPVGQQQVNRQIARVSISAPVAQHWATDEHRSQVARTSQNAHADVPLQDPRGLHRHIQQAERGAGCEARRSPPKHAGQRQGQDRHVPVRRPLHSRHYMRYTSAILFRASSCHIGLCVAETAMGRHVDAQLNENSEYVKAVST